MTAACSDATSGFVVGDVARICLVTRDRFGTLTDPATLTLRTRDPVGVVTLYTFGVDPQIVKDSTGRFTASIPVSVAGDWLFYWTATGDAAGVAEGKFHVAGLSF